MDLEHLEAEHRVWHSENFGLHQPAWPSLLGVSEEVGELCHAFLKRHEGLRSEEDHDAAIRDAIGDIVIYLLGFCKREEISFSECLEETWERVKQRNYALEMGSK